MAASRRPSWNRKVPSPGLPWVAVDAPSFLPPENHQTMSIRSPEARCRRMSRMMIRLDSTSMAPPATPQASAAALPVARQTPIPVATVISTFSTSSTKVSSQAPSLDCWNRTRASSPSQPSSTDCRCSSASPSSTQTYAPVAISAHPSTPNPAANSVIWLGVIGDRQSTWRVNQMDSGLLKRRATKPRSAR